MGTWDSGPFDNDDAADLLARMGTRLSPDLARGVLQACLVPADAYLEAPKGQSGIAVAALVRHLVAGDDVQFGDRVIAFDDVRADPELTAELHRVSLRVLARVLDRHSEIRELWAESARFPEWLDGVERLRAELSRNR